MQTIAQVTRTRKLAARSGRLAQHDANCQALVDAYVARRQRDRRSIERDIEALLQGEAMQPVLWDAEFDAERYLDSLSPVLQSRYRLL
jgi:hypothetical protein